MGRKKSIYTIELEKQARELYKDLPEGDHKEEVVTWAISILRDDNKYSDYDYDDYTETYEERNDYDDNYLWN